MFTHDELVSAVRSPLLGNEIARLWGFDEAPVVPADLTPQAASASFFPPPGGIRAVLWTAPPAGGVIRHSGGEEQHRLTDELLPGMASVVVGTDGMHATATIDFEFVLQGEIELAIDGGESRTLRAGDAAVVGGVRHAWRNLTNETCLLLAVFYGARRV